jgi:hypothetical protein
MPTERKPRPRPDHRIASPRTGQPDPCLVQNRVMREYAAQPDHRDAGTGVPETVRDMAVVEP